MNRPTRPRRRSRLLPAALAALLAAPVLAAVGASPVSASGTYSNAGSIAINDKATLGDPPKEATPYPSTISVSGETGTITALTLTLTNLTHSSTGDIDAMVVGPDGTNLLFLSDSGTSGVTNCTVTFDDAAASSLPSGGAWSGCPAITTKPVNYGASVDTFPAPAPSPSANTTLSAFNGKDPNGTWSLYIVDDALGDTGSVNGGWSLGITTAAIPATTTALISSVNPSFVGGAVTFTATVTSSGTPVTTGTVTFTDDGVVVQAAAAPDGNGQVTYTTNELDEGDHPIVAQYSGTGSLGPSNGSLTQNVDNHTVVTGNQFCNPGSVSVPKASTTAGPGRPFPSHVFVSGIPENLANITVDLKQVGHVNTPDMDVMLVSPHGQSLLLVSDSGSGSATNDNLTFDDAAATSLPQSSSWGSSLSITTKPVNYGIGPDPFPAPAPQPSAATTLASLTRYNPNGTWSLYAVDDGLSDVGAIAGGWCLNLTPGAITRHTPLDVDNDSTSDLGVYRTSSGTWWFNRSSAGPTGSYYGLANTDIPVPADYDGIGMPELATFRPGPGAPTKSLWFVFNPNTSSTTQTAWGVAGDQPVPGDYDGDGKADLAVYRPSLGAWFVKRSSDAAETTTYWGNASDDVPVPADYDGDGITDMAVFRPSAGLWLIKRSSDGVTDARYFGDTAGDDVPVPADYDGDGVADISVYRASAGIWFVNNSFDGSTTSAYWGLPPDDVPAPGDFDGDGRADMTVYRPSLGAWFVLGSSAGGYQQYWGTSGDVPLTLPYPVRAVFFPSL